LRSERHVTLLGDLVAAAAEPRLTPEADRSSREVFPRLVERAWRRLAKAVDALDLAGPAEDWHRARILAKRARYAAESVAPVLGPEAKRLGDALKRVTDLLGDHHDAWVAQQRLRDLAALPAVDGATGLALGLLDALEAQREREDRELFLMVWPEVRAVHRAAHLG